MMVCVFHMIHIASPEIFSTSVSDAVKVITLIHLLDVELPLWDAIMLTAFAHHAKLLLLIIDKLPHASLTVAENISLVDVKFVKNNMNLDIIHASLKIVWFQAMVNVSNATLTS